MSNTKFSSEGFDLDAVAGLAISNGDDNATGGDVVFEIGGGASVDVTAQKQHDSGKATENDESKQEKTAKKPPTSSVMDKADEFKEQGNAAFKEGNWLEAYDSYTAAIEATPGDVTGEQLLKLRDDWREEQIKEQRRKMDRQEEERRQKQLQKRQEEKNKKSNDNDKKIDDNAADDDDQQEEDEEKQQSAAAAAASAAAAPPPRFEPPPHVHGTKLAVFYANRAATLLHLQRYESAVRDCDVALLYNPIYTKAYLRRCSAHENLQQTEDALLDAKSALATTCTATTATTASAAERNRIQKLVTRLQKLEDERLEKLKAETMDKLKDLGNSILGNFGLSLDNFQTVQDPKTGSYSISFNQGGNNNNKSS